MNLFLNAVSKEGIIILFWNDKNIIDKKSLSIVWNESWQLIDIVSTFLKSNKIDFSNLENIVFVNWPWSFTWIRIISLFVNTLSFVYTKLYLTDISFFDMFWKYPIIKVSSKRDLFVKKSKQDIIEVISNEEFKDYVKQNNTKEIFWEQFDKLKINSKIDYENLIKSIKFKKEKIINPLYIKKPSIN